MDKGFFGSLFDFDGDGELDAIERTHDFMAFNELMIGAEKAEKEDAVNELEEAGLDPDDFDF
jgi:hypothetical protein